MFKYSHYNNSLLNLAGVYFFLIITPIIPIFILYWFFGKANYFDLTGWGKGVLATGPIAAYMFLLYLGFRNYIELFNLTSRSNFDEPEFLLGKWQFSSKTLTSGKTSSGEANFTFENGKLEFGATLKGMDGLEFAVVRSDFVFFDSTKDIVRILYRTEALGTNGYFSTIDCIASARVSRGGDDTPLLMQGNWMEISGDGKHSGTTVLKRITQKE